jgi:NAD(P)-dependent dehydrogenase (short-subunit alcohol dehydrogenase family)
VANHGLAAGKAGLVTGAGSGIGRASALLFGAEGATGVVVADIDGNAADETVAQLTGMGVAAVSVAVDISNRAHVEDMVGLTVERFGRLDFAEAAVWLCSDRASFVTGVAFPVDNGATIGGITSHTDRADSPAPS